jgi:hypothetical protein
VSQVVECLRSKHEALNLKLSTTPPKKEKPESRIFRTFLMNYKWDISIDLKIVYNIWGKKNK